MSRYRIYIIFSLIIAGGLIAVSLVSSGYYPVLMVNGDFISAKRFLREYRAATIYYENLLKTYSQGIGDEEKLGPDELQLAVINSLIEKSLIADGARDEAGDDFGYLLGNKLENVSVDKELEKAITSLYGMNRDEFILAVMVPQAEREILAGRIFLRGEKIDDWIADAKKDANVIIFSPNFKWDKEKIISK